MQRQGSMRAKDYTLYDLPDAITEPFTITSPRSADALARNGVLLEELQYRSRQHFMDKDMPEEIVRMRYEHAEWQRRERIKQVKHEYKVVCATPGTRLPSRPCPTGSPPSLSVCMPVLCLLPLTHIERAVIQHILEYMRVSLPVQLRSTPAP